MAFALVTIYDKEGEAHILPPPSTYSGITSTLVDSARNTQGVVVGSVIRDDIAKIELTWRYLTTEEWSDINLLFKTGAGGSFYNDVKFFDQTEGNFVTRQMYVNDRSAGAFKCDEDGQITGWQDCRLNLIEV